MSFLTLVHTHYQVVSALTEIEKWISDEFDNHETADQAAQFYESDDADDAMKNFRSYKKEFELKFKRAKMEHDGLVVFRCTKKENPEAYIAEIKKNGEVGAYWSYTKEGAQCIFGKDKPGQELLIKALLPLNEYEQINSVETAIRNADPQYKHEDEIVFEKGTVLKLLEIRDKKTGKMLWKETPINIKLKPAFYSH